LEILNENSPLLSPTNPQDGSFIRRENIPENALDWADEEAAQESKSVWYLFLLTLSIGG